MVISQPPGNNPSYYYRASPTLPQLLWMLQRHLMFYTCNYNIRVTHRNGAIKHIFLHRSTSTEDHQQIVLYSFCRSAAFLHLAVKILLQIFLCRRFEHVVPIICRLYFPPECQQDRAVTQPILLSENIPNIWHKSSTKHKEVRPDWNDKNDNANYALVSHGRFTNGSGCHF